MAPSAPDSQSILRPAMRRKSSAQNLLSSFRPSTSSSTSSTNNNNNNNINNTTATATPGSSSNGITINGTHAPQLLPAHILSAPLPPTPAPPPSSYFPPQGNTSTAPTSALPTPSTSGTSTPSHPQFASLHLNQQQQSAFVALGGPASAAAVAATMREWDAQSMHADAQSPFMPLVAGGGSPGATVEYLRDLVQKRIITLTYMRNVHDGCVLLSFYVTFGWLLMSAVLRHRRSHWFHTIAMSRTELDRVFNNTAMKKRCVVAIPGSCPAYAAQDTTIRGSRHVALIHFRRPAAYRLSTFGAKHAHRVRASERRQRPSKNGISLPHLTPHSP
jgi:hypothetical protein